MCRHHMLNNYENAYVYMANDLNQNMKDTFIAD